LSLDGEEGPGNYGLNKECMMTILATRQDKVTANFALVQPGIADAPKVIAALAEACGDSDPPPIEQLADPQMAGARDARERRAPPRRAEQGDFPGAVPADPKLNSLLRQFLRPTNDAAAVDKLRAEMDEYLKANPGLVRQAIDGWTRVLHFGDRYGTEYSRQAGRELLEKWKAGPAK
jgi:hypothetical protein